ncbi:MAG TPA: hypothetical protein VNE41_05010 [Chitinophagaceae bacterium]|nr:hypothetical protein [Chitinophagaceae bacterium]
MRKGNTIFINYQVDENIKALSIAPLLIMPLIENAFKYVSAFTDQAYNINKHFQYANRTFEMQMENTMDTPVRLSSLKSGGGLDMIILNGGCS